MADWADDLAAAFSLPSEASRMLREAQLLTLPPHLSQPMAVTSESVAKALRFAIERALDATNDSILLSPAMVASLRQVDPACPLLGEAFTGQLGIYQAWRLVRGLERQPPVAVARGDGFAFTMKLQDYGTPPKASDAPMFDLKDVAPRFQRGPDLVDHASFVRERDLVNRWVSAAVNASGRLCPVERADPEAWARDQTAYLLGLLDRLKALQVELEVETANHDQTKQVADRRAKRLETLELLERAIRDVVLSAPLTNATA